MKLLLEFLENEIWNLELCHERKQQDKFSSSPNIFYYVFIQRQCEVHNSHFVLSPNNEKR